MSASTKVTCDQCGQPAVYRLKGELVAELRCEPCAIRFGYERRGEAYTAMKTLGFAVSLLRDAGINDGAIAGMLQTILTSPHSDGEYPIGGDEFLPGPDRSEERPWNVGMVPVGVA